MPMPPITPSRRDLLIGSALMAAAPTPSTAATPVTGTPPVPPQGPRKTLGMVVFEGFELLDVFGPLEMFGMINDRVDTVLIAEKAGPVASRTGPKTVADVSFADAPKLDIVMVPGGSGTRREVDNPAFLGAMKRLAEATPQVASVCTGSGLLAKAGLLNGVRATSNKMAWQWATAQGKEVHWVPHARWVEDGRFITSSGVSAGTDMALALIAKLYGKVLAQWVADRAEYRWNQDAGDDPFAAINGL